MVANTNRNTLGVNELSHVMRMHACHVKGHGADAVHVLARTKNTDALDVTKLQQLGRDGLFMGFDVLQPMFIIHSAATPAATTWATGWVPASKRAGGAMY